MSAPRTLPRNRIANTADAARVLGFPPPDFLVPLIAETTGSLKILSPEGRLLFINEAGLRHLEIAKAEFALGRQWWEFWHHADEAATREMLGCALMGASLHVQANRNTRGGSKGRWDITVKPIERAPGSIGALLVLSHPIDGADSPGS